MIDAFQQLNKWQWRFFYNYMVINNQVTQLKGIYGAEAPHLDKSKLKKR